MVHVAGHDQHIAGHLTDVSEKGQVVAGVGEEHQLQIPVDVGAVGVASSVLRVVTLGVRQTQVCATTY